MRGLIHVYEDIDTIGFWRVIIRNGINVNVEDGEEEGEGGGWRKCGKADFDVLLLLLSNRHPRGKWSSGMWNVPLPPGTESIPGHCFNGQGHKSPLVSLGQQQQHTQPSVFYSERLNSARSLAGLLMTML